MRKYILREKLVLDLNKPHCIFASIYCNDFKPYKYYDIKYKDKKIPSILMQMRWDGSIGFPGGKVEVSDYGYKLTEDDLKNALCRELKEEINLLNIDTSKLKHSSTFESDIQYIHNFKYEVNAEELINIYNNSSKAKHFFSENCGCILFQCAKYTEEKGYNNFVSNKFCASSLLELNHLIENEGLLIDFTKAC